MVIIDLEFMVMFVKVMFKNIKDMDFLKDWRKMSENDKRWVSVDKWG